MLFKTLRWSFLFTIIGLAIAFLYDGVTGVTVTAILIVLEVSLSFDNAVVNAKVLNRMSEFWVKIFLTVGILIAVFGMRLLFPLVVVFVTAGLSPIEAWDLALEKGNPDTPGTYGYILNDAHPLIAAFGGMFLLMIFLDFVFDEDKEHHWLGPVERALSKAAAFPGVSVLVALVWLFVFSRIFSEESADMLLAGVFGIILYLAVNGLGDFFDGGLEDELDDEGERRASTGEVVKATGKAAFSLFLYLELLDASFSFDGVIGAFAITSDPIIIALGLGVGAFYVRSITIYLVHQGTLSEYVFLEHGAHWAIGALALLLFVSIGPHIPEVVTGLVGVAFILLALWSSINYNKKHRGEDHVVHV
ncbi:DUF475 domain-containing protein [Nocardioides dongxiaopingii]|uniref:DUF475 domain-containing protein n=1 Tax=Nocardioides sp. S-1144 TaxID=2582905 RepID=UPI00110ECBC9|nr:DUF475 domain-containing protein [Nocardioides sp. S-1144]QCW51265.1 DUF475 domain-containing protein [Nocardioides sp. S-1144]